jgi:hypothetical protein
LSGISRFSRPLSRPENMLHRRMTLGDFPQFPEENGKSL